MKKTEQKKQNNISLLLQISSDIVASLVIGTVIGVYLDKMLDTKPILLIICLIFSLAAAFKLIYQKIK